MTKITKLHTGSRNGEVNAGGTNIKHAYDESAVTILTNSQSQTPASASARNCLRCRCESPVVYVKRHSHTIKLFFVK
ncbi:MAG: hypothetical protein ACK5IJ_11125 [Mangrovibacterium sp.]